MFRNYGLQNLMKLELIYTNVIMRVWNNLMFHCFENSKFLFSYSFGFVMIFHR
jgi:hypothetical protein